MKKFITLLVCAFIINSCDDGDKSLDTFNFDHATEINNCITNDGLFFKVKKFDALILKTPITTFANTVSVANSPRNLVINSINQVNLFYILLDKNLGCSLTVFLIIGFLEENLIVSSK